MTHVERLRRKLGLTQTAFARLAGVNQSTVSRWERGEGEPTLSEIGKIVSEADGAVQPNDFFDMSHIKAFARKKSSRSNRGGEAA